MVSGVCLRGCDPRLGAVCLTSWGLVIGGSLDGALMGDGDLVELPITLCRRRFYLYPVGFWSFSRCTEVISTRFLSHCEAIFDTDATVLVS